MIRILVKSKTFFLLLALSGILSHSSALYVEFTPLKAQLNTNTVANYNFFIEVLRALQRGSALPEAVNNPEASQQIEAQREALLRYFTTLDELSALPAGSGWVLIDPEWVLSAKHVLAGQVKPNGPPVALEMPGGVYIGVVDGVYYHPNVDLDLALSHLTAPHLKTPPLVRYRSPDPQNTNFFAYSGTLHNEKGQVIASWAHNLTDVRTFGLCTLVPESNVGNAVLPMLFDTAGPLKVTTHGGDSGGPLFVKVRDTGNPFQDYQLAGIYNPGGARLSVMYVPHPSINNWIDNIIVGQALGTAPAPNIEVRF